MPAASPSRPNCSSSMLSGNAHEISDGIVPPDLEVKVRPCRPLTTPMGLCRDAGVLIPTYCNDTVMRMPPDVDPAIDRQRIRETGRRLADGYLRDSPLLASNVTSEPAAGDGFTAKEALETSREFATNFPGAH